MANDKIKGLFSVVGRNKPKKPARVAQPPAAEGPTPRPTSAREEFERRIDEHRQRLSGTRMPREQRSVATDDWVDPAAHDRLRQVHSKSPAVRGLIDRLATKGHDEPYFGPDVHNAVWSDQSRDLPQQFPAKGTDPKGVVGKGVRDGSGPDPLAWMDTKYGATKRLLARHKGKPLEVHTRSDLIAHDDYMQHLTPGQHKVFIHMPTDDSRVAQVLEPGAPSPKRRLDAAAKLAHAGHDVTVVHDQFDHPDGKSQFQWNSVNRFSHKGLPASVKFAPNKIRVSEGAANRLSSVGLGSSVRQKAKAPPPAQSPALRVVKSQKNESRLNIINNNDLYKHNGHECQYCRRLKNWEEYRGNMDASLQKDGGIAAGISAAAARGGVSPSEFSSAARSGFGDTPPPPPPPPPPVTKSGTAPLDKAKVYNPQKKVQNIKVPEINMPTVQTPRVPKPADPNIKIKNPGPDIAKSQYAKTEPAEVRVGQKKLKARNDQKKERINQQLRTEVTDFLDNRHGKKYEGAPARPKKTLRGIKDKPAGAPTNPVKD